MARQATTSHPTHLLSDSSLSVSQSATATPTEIAEQLARVDALHAQLKAETLKAQEFLLKFRRGEYDPPAQTHTKSNGRTAHQEGTAKQQHNSPKKEQKAREMIGKKEAVNTATNGGHTQGVANLLDHDHTAHPTGSVAGKKSEYACSCSCPHESLLSSEAEALIRKQRGSFAASPTLHTHVDEREVRDLEKRVRGLEGRVRGFEGFPPDREMALVEVERLRRELEGLARRREGLFEGLCGELADTAANALKKGTKIIKAEASAKSMANNQGNRKAAAINSKAAGNGKR